MMSTQRRVLDRRAFLLILLTLQAFAAHARAGDAETVRLIDRLAEVGEEGIGFHTTAWAVGFIAVDEEPKFAGGIIGSSKPVVSPIMRALVRRGVAALPDLIDHLSDRRETKIRARAMGMWLCTEYDARDAAPRIYSAGPLKRGSLDLGRDNAVSSYTARVGDLCFVAIGAGSPTRNLRAIRYQPSRHHCRYQLPRREAGPGRVSAKRLGRPDNGAAQEIASSGRLPTRLRR